MADRYINETLILILCHKAGIPKADAKGNITSHRARSTIASQLFNAKEPMHFSSCKSGLDTSGPIRPNII